MCFADIPAVAGLLASPRQGGSREEVTVTNSGVDVRVKGGDLSQDRFYRGRAEQ